MPLISVIVVNWNGLHLLKRCLRALQAQRHDDYEVIVVDNGSRDGSAAWVREQGGPVRLVALPRNLGFSGGVNVGLRMAQGRYLVLLNNDATADPGFLAEIVRPLEEDRAIGAASGVLLFEGRPDLIASAGITVGRDGLARDFLGLMPACTLPDHPVPVFGATGGAACYRREMLEDVGLLEERFFAYLEDADLAWRARLRRWEAVTVPGARAQHRYSATGVQGSPFKERMLARNRLRTIIRCVPGPLLMRCLASILLYDLQAMSLAALRRRPWIIRGRVEALRELPRLLEERRAIQRRRTAEIEDLARLLVPPVTPWVMLAEQRELAAVLRGSTT